jgi:aspartokinase
VATERDYRQALNFALDARERAHEAARTSAERMAQVRSEAETLMQSTDNLLRVGQSRARPVAARAPQAVHDAFAQAEKDLQEARAALTRQDFVTARDQARAISERLRDAIVALEEATSPKDRRAPPKRAPR